MFASLILVILCVQTVTCNTTPGKPKVVQVNGQVKVMVGKKKELIDPMDYIRDHLTQGKNEDQRRKQDSWPTICRHDPSPKFAPTSQGSQVASFHDIAFESGFRVRRRYHA